MDEILMALIKDDKNLLLRRDELIGKLDEKVPANLRRDYIAIRKALELNVGEIFAVGSSDRDSARYKALKVLSSSGLSEQRIDFVIKTFSRVLGWNENSNAQTDSLIERVEKLERNVCEVDNVVYSLIKRVKKLETTLAQREYYNEKLKAQVDELNKRLQTLENRLHSCEQFLDTNPASTSTTTSTENFPSWMKDDAAKTTTTSTENFPAWMKYNATKTTTTSTNDAAKNFVFLDQYNALLKIRGLERHNKQTEFIKKFSVKYLICANATERMNKPITPPIFKYTTTTRGDYFAVQMSGSQYAILPNIYLYHDNLHYERAMGEVFYSNFVNGHEYENISVKRPAIFECKGDVWTLKEKGGLNLS